MITGTQMRDARLAAGWTQEQLAERLEVTLRTVGNWERGGPPATAQARLRAVLRDHLDDAGEPPLRSVSDAELLAEIARRFSRSAQRTAGDLRGDTAPMTDVERTYLTLVRELGDDVTLGHLRASVDLAHPGAGVDVPGRPDVPHEVDELAHRRRAEIAERIATGDQPAAARTDEDQ